MKTTKNTTKTGALGAAIAFAILAIAIASFGYGWHRVVSAQSPGDSASPDTPQAVAHGKILFTRFVNGIAKVFIVDSNSVGSETCLGMCSDASDTSAGQDAVWSPDRSTVAFTRSGEIWLMNADGSNQRRIAAGGVTGGNATFSSDGTKIAFTRPCSSCGQFSTDIWMMNADGSSQTQLTNSTHSDRNPSWKPGANLIAFTRGFAAGNQIFAVTTGASESQLTNVFQRNSVNARWSPDGSKLVFESDRDTGFGFRPEIYLMNADGSNVQRITTDNFDDHNPTFSPDGTLIAWLSGSRAETSNNKVFVMNADGTNQHLITGGTSSDSSTPSWAALLPHIASFTKTGPTNGSITFNAVTDSGLAVRVQSTTNDLKGVEGSWTDLPDGNGAQMHEDSPANPGKYSLTTTAYPHANNIVFRAISSLKIGSTQFTDGKSDPVGPYDLIPPNFPATMTFDGRLRDKVSRTDTGTGGDGDPDGTFTLSLPGTVSNKLLSKIQLSGPNGSAWDTITGNTIPVLGVGLSLDSSLINAGGLIPQNFLVGNNAVFKLFASEISPAVFVQGNTFNVTVMFTDGSTATAAAPIDKTQADIGVVFSPRPPSSANMGDAITFSALVTNNGPDAAHGVQFKGTVDPKFSNLSVTNGIGCSVSGNVVTCNIGDIDKNSTIHVAFSTQAFQPTPNGTALVNRVAVTVDTSKTIDNNSTNDSDSATTGVVPQLTLVGLEVTQAVQNLKNDIPLVAGRPTFVRAHVLSKGGFGVLASASLSARDVSTGINNRCASDVDRDRFAISG